MNVLRATKQQVRPVPAPLRRFSSSMEDGRLRQRSRKLGRRVKVSRLQLAAVGVLPPD
jgi:hypothetical protein